MRPNISFILLVGFIAISSIVAEDAVKPWPAPVTSWPAPTPVAGFQAPVAGEHPRLFFRKSDLPEIKKRAQTPEGQVIVKRLGLLLNGKDGKTLPEILPEVGIGAQVEHGKALTLWHPAGYGMMYHLTGDKLYADLGKEAMKHIFTDTGDIDGRYSFVKNSNKNYCDLRAGGAIGAVAMGYDLCYDGWDEAFRTEVVMALQKGPAGFPLENLAKGGNKNPRSNHWGAQIGGSALAMLAISKDTGVDQAKIEALMEESKLNMIRQVTQGFGDGGMYSEGQGPGGIASDTAFIPAIQAWRVAGGQDFVSPRPNVAAITMLKVHELLRINGEPWYPICKPSNFGTGYMGMKGESDRDSLARAGQFAQGFGTIPDQLKPAALWVFNHIVEPDETMRTYDTISRYPHRAVLALVNWPIGVKEQNPAAIMPRVHFDLFHGMYSFRNQWTGTDDDIVVDATCRARDPHQLMIWGKGERRILATIPKGPTNHFQAAEDGSGTLTVGSMQLGVDFSKASGADGLIVTIGLPMSGAKSIDCAGKTYNILLLGGKPDQPQVVGDAVVISSQEIRSDGKKIIFSKMAGPQKFPRLGLWKASEVKTNKNTSQGTSTTTEEKGE